MKKELFILTALVFLFFSYTETPPAEIQTPAGYEEVQRAEGDLDKDRLPEKVIVYRTPEGSEMRIYKQRFGEWELLHQTKGAILLENDYSVLRFSSIKVERGCIVTYHNSPGRSEWSFTHRYRLQGNQWKLIGVTEHVGYYCDYFSDTDCNLSTGEVAFDHINFKCDNQYAEKIKSEEHKKYTVKLAKLPNMDQVSVSDHEIEVVEGDFKVFY